jgi:lipoate-protein ligase A
MGLADDRSLRASVTTLAEQLGRPCPLTELEQAVLEAFRRDFGITLEEGVLSNPEARQEDVSEPSFHAG